MPKSQAFAIATQQSYAAGKAPKGYGTSEGRHEAKEKYDDPKSHYEPKAKPSTKSKEASLSFSLDLVRGFSNELTKIANPMFQLLSEGLQSPEGKKLVANALRSSEAQQAIGQAAWNGFKAKAVPLAKKIGVGAVGAGAAYAGYRALTREKKASEVPGPATVGSIVKSTVPKNTLRVGAAKYSRIAPPGPESPLSRNQSVLEPPPVRT